MRKIQSIRGMLDVLPGDSARWQWVEARVEDVLRRFGYRQIRLPLLEETGLFARGVGETSDIVEKEMYTFDDRAGDSVTLRPEGTAGCVRACEQHGLLYNQTQRLWYQGPMFRYERPQKGRYRQFEQIGAECFGLAGPDIDAELLLLTAELWRALGVDHAVRLELNTLGTAEARGAWRHALMEYFRGFEGDLDEDSRRRLERNPMRIFDSKVPRTQEIVAGAPSFDRWLDDASREHFDGLCARLDAAGIEALLNPTLVRGLDYYSRTVFEWTTDALGAQGTVCAGGRYDGLVELLGGRPTPGIGFAMGIDRLLLLAEAVGSVPAEVGQEVDAYLVPMDEEAELATFALATELRTALPRLRLQMHCGGGKMKARFKRAEGSGARFALLLGGDELAAGTVTLKTLGGDAPNRTLTRAALIDELRAAYG
jgi:histidyl-tRNA synthetase